MWLCALCLAGTRFPRLAALGSGWHGAPLQCPRGVRGRPGTGAGVWGRWRGRRQRPEGELPVGATGKLCGDSMGRQKRLHICATETQRPSLNMSWMTAQFTHYEASNHNELLKALFLDQANRGSSRRKTIK